MNEITQEITQSEMPGCSSSLVEATDLSEEVQEAVVFKGYKSMLLTTVELDDQLSCPGAMTVAKKSYNELKASFEHFQHLLKKASTEEEEEQAKTPKKRQATLFDMFHKNNN